MTIRDSNVTINVKDLNTSVAFYESIGFTMKNRWGDYYAQLVAPGITLGLHPTSKHKSENSGNVSIGFTVDNFDEAATHLANQKINATKRHEEGGQFIHFNDPDGTALYIINPKGQE